MSNGSDSYGSPAGSHYAAYSHNDPSATPTLRRRQVTPSSPATPSGSTKSSGSNSVMVQRLDFMFPKVETQFTVHTERGGMVSLGAYILILVLALAETVTWIGQNRSTAERIAVDTALGKRMLVKMNITFPGLACEDLHVDAMDVAGDSQINVEDTLVKKRLHEDGSPYSGEEIRVETNAHRLEQEKKERILKEDLPENYCGPCFGAQETDDQCCQTCDELIEAYEKKNWSPLMLQQTAEQCIREGRDKKEPKKMTKGEGCNLSGHMTVNRVAGNFHIAMGEGIERDGRHIHTFLPDDTPNFNASHVIHELSFGSGVEDGSPLNGVTKIVTEQHGTTGLFQYFIKVVPTTYVGDELIQEKGGKSGAGKIESLETNRYFFTERFRPLMQDLLEDEHMEDEDSKQASVQAGHSGGHGNAEHHKFQNSLLPGVFFIYEIYPFAVEISRNGVPFTHLLIRLMATVGGVFTFIRWLDSFLFARELKNRREARRSANVMAG